MIIAVRYGRITMVSQLLDSRANPGIHDGSSKTTLLHTDNVEAAALLIQHGALVNERDKEGKTALMIAAICRKTDIVSLLLENEASPNIRNVDKRTALMFASNVVVAALLIQHGALVNEGEKARLAAICRKTDLSRCCMKTKRILTFAMWIRGQH